MAVFGEKKGHQLRVYILIAAEVSAEEPADQISVDRGVIPWEMDIFESAVDAFEVASESLYLSGFACTVEAFEDN